MYIYIYYIYTFYIYIHFKYIYNNLEYNTCLKLSNGSKDKSLPIMYWIPKLNKNPVGSRFIIASKKCLTKP